VNVEGDYNEDQAAAAARMMGWNDTTYPSPTTPADKWDYYAKAYGYAYRGQPSIAYKVPFKLADVGETSASTDAPAGRSSWDVWADGYGSLEPITFTASDVLHMSDQNGSGADRLRRDAQGHRLVVAARVASELPAEPPAPTESRSDAGMPDASMDAMVDEPAEPAPPSCGKPGASGNDAQEPTGGAASPTPEPVSNGSSDGVVIENTGDCQGGPIGAIEGLRLRRHPNELRAHEWIMLRFRAVHSKQPLHEYEVRVATEPILDEASFVRVGRPARNATDDSEGATALTLPTDVPAGQDIETAIGDLVADTHYFVAVRATDEFNQHGPISVAEISTPVRKFATVTPCFVATAAYGTPLATQIGALRRFRDRQLSSTAPGRAFVAAYQAYGPRAARVIARHENLRSWVRGVLAPLIALVRHSP
jgi:hypothetical protein